jgi:hypothetical protein
MDKSVDIMDALVNNHIDVINVKAARGNVRRD